MPGSTKVTVIVIVRRAARTARVRVGPTDPARHNAARSAPLRVVVVSEYFLPGQDIMMDKNCKRKKI